MPQTAVFEVPRGLGGMKMGPQSASKIITKSTFTSYQKWSPKGSRMDPQIDPKSIKSSSWKGLRDPMVCQRGPGAYPKTPRAPKCSLGDQKSYSKWENVRFFVRFWISIYCVSLLICVIVFVLFCMLVFVFSSWLHGWLHVWHFACSLACLSVCWLPCLLACLFVCLLVCLLACLFACLPAYLLVFLFALSSSNYKYTLSFFSLLSALSGPSCPYR